MLAQVSQHDDGQQRVAPISNRSSHFLTNHSRARIRPHCCMLTVPTQACSRIDTHTLFAMASTAGGSQSCCGKVPMVGPVLEFYGAHTNPDTTWLSNFFEEPFEIEGKSWRTVEHYFQAAKFARTAPSYAETIRTCGTPAAAKKLGRSRAHALDPDWESTKEDIMLRGLRAKFAPSTALSSRLVATGKSPLIEAAPSDLYWGIGKCRTGRNRLGCLLMQVRDELRAAHADGGSSDTEVGSGAGAAAMAGHAGPGSAARASPVAP
jgi:ribA/ribD-fused uncharacterized protein